MKRSVCVAVAALAAYPALAAEFLPSLTVTAEGKPACYSQEVRLPGSRTLLAKICAVEEVPDRPEYYAEVEARVVAGGTGDEVARGVTGAYLATPLMFRCLPLVTSSGAAPVGRIEAAQARTPNGSDEGRTATGPDMIETGRVCSLRAANLVDLLRVEIRRE